MTTKKRLIGYGYTNGSGIATLDYTADGTAISPSGYLGSGGGEIDIKAEMHDDNTVQSAPYPICDAMFYDKGLSGTGQHNDNWTTETGLTVERQSDGTLLTNTLSSGKAHRVGTYPSNYLLWDKPFAVEFDAVSNSGTVRLYLTTSSGGSNLDRTIQQYLTTDINHVKLILRDNNYDLIVDGETKLSNQSHSLVSPVGVGFVVNGGETFKYKDFALYPI